MANVDELTLTGLQTKDNNTLVNDLIQGFTDIYTIDDPDINFDSNTPDGQLIQLFAYAGTTIREMITEVYNSCDPDKCVGAVQDNRYQINYLTRKQGSYTLQNIAITTNKTVKLQGLDAAYNESNVSAFAVSDDNGNIWYLVDSVTLNAGTSVVEFRAQNIGEIIPTIGTITTIVTIIPGVLSVINNVGATSIGKDEESDSDFRIRRERSVALAAKNNVDSMEGNLLALDGVVDVKIHENRTNSTDSTGTAAHTVWAIVQGGANSEIADVIYNDIGGAGTRGSVIVPITTVSLEEININFDRENIVPLYIKFDVLPVTDIAEISLPELKTYITENLQYNISEDAETSKITQVCADGLLTQGNNGYALNVEVSLGGSATASIGASTGITAASVDVINFQYMVQDTAGTYIFSFANDEWTLNSDIVDLTNYGISYTGTPANGDNITISYTASSWTDYIAVSSLADKFTTDENKIYITAV